MNELLTLKGVVFEDKDNNNLLSEGDLVVDLPMKIKIMDSNMNLLASTENSIDGWEVQVPESKEFFIEFVSGNKILDTIGLSTEDGVNEYILNFQINSNLNENLVNNGFSSLNTSNLVLIIIVILSILIGGVVFYKLVSKNNYKSSS